MPLVCYLFYTLVTDLVSFVYFSLTCVGCMTSTKSLANLCWLIVQKNLVDNFKDQKILHWTQSGVSSWFDIAYEIGKIAEKLKVINKAAKVIPISSKKFLILISPIF